MDQSSSAQAGEPEGGRLYSRNLPADIVFDILLKLPVKSLLRYRCVCKVLCNIIDSPSFANKHMSIHVAAEEPEFMYHYLYGENVPKGLYSVRYDGNVMRANKYPILDFSRPHFYVPHYLSYGLFCFYNDKEEVILFNPLRGEVMILPQVTVSLRPTAVRYGLGFDGTTDTYKIVRLFYHAQNPGLVAEVYTLGTRSWRRISSDVPLCEIIVKGVVSAYGDIHWQNIWSYPKVNEGIVISCCSIISFDSRKEEFNWTPQPDNMNEIYKHAIHLLNMRGSLAMVGILSPTLDIWVMKDYDTKEWAREYRVNMDLWRREPNNFPFPPPMFAGVWEHGLYLSDSNNIYLYDLKTGYLKCVSYLQSTDDDFDISSRNTINSYTGTLVSLKNYGHSVAAELGHGLPYALNNANLVYIFP